MLHPPKASDRPVDFSPNVLALSAGLLLCLALGACTPEKATAVAWKFRFGCAADSKRTDLIKVQIAKGSCPLKEPVLSEAWTSTPGSTVYRPQGLPSGDYAFHATALDIDGDKITSDCKSVTLPMQDVISLELQASSSCDDGNVTPAEPDAGLAGREPDGGGLADGGGNLTDGGGGLTDGGDNLTDASRPDGGGLADAASPDASPCSTWWRDADTDGFGDISLVTQSCTQPSGYVANSDDCDDSDGARRPGATELCDMTDSDCDGSNTEECPAQCTPIAFESRLYLACRVMVSWNDAAATCTTAGMTLVRIDSMAENEFLRVTAFPLLDGGDLWIGASDSAEEGVWRWTSNGDVVWRGGPALSGGAAEGSAFTRWKDTEPGGGTTENCAQLREGSLWNDGDCASAREFVCEQP